MKTKHRFTIVSLIITSIILTACGAQFQSPVVFPTATLSPEQQTQLVQVCSLGGVAVVLKEGEDPIPCPKSSTASTPGATTTSIIAGPTLKRVGTMFQTPVKATAIFNKESGWMFAEPGVLLNASTIFTIPGLNVPYSSNCPEGAFWYGSMGEGQIEINGVTIVLQPEKGLNYLIAIRCKIDDTIVDSDLNLTPKISKFVPGHATWAFMPTGGYISKDWFRQQMVASSTGSFTNCGATGCSRVRIVLYDVSSRRYQMFEVKSNALDIWTLVEYN